jgi:hypothetical protein
MLIHEKLKSKSLDKNLIRLIILIYAKNYTPGGEFSVH